MKKAALLIAIISIAAATLADRQMRVVHGYAPHIIKTSCSDSFQKPKGDELTEMFSQVYPITPTGRVNIVNINGDVHINVGAIVQLKPEVAIIGQTGVVFVDFDSNKLVYPLEALIQYSLSNMLDVVGRAGFDDLSDGDTFGVRVGAVFRI